MHQANSQVSNASWLGENVLGGSDVLKLEALAPDVDFPFESDCARSVVGCSDKGYLLWVLLDPQCSRRGIKLNNSPPVQLLEVYAQLLCLALASSGQLNDEIVVDIRLYASKLDNLELLDQVKVLLLVKIKV